MDIRLPNLGDGVSQATVLDIIVSVGDSVSVDDTLLELETDKAVAPIPSPAAGTVESIVVKSGDKVSEGTVIVTLSGADAPAAPVSAPAPAAAAAPAPVAPVAAAPVAAAPVSVDVGSYQAQSGEPAPTSASIRQFARQFGLDLLRIPGTGNGGRITNDDVRNYISFLQAKAFQAAPGDVAVAAAQPQGPQPLNIDFSKWGAVDVEAVSSLRQKIAENMAETWRTVPHVTQFDSAQIDHVMALRKKYNDKYKAKKARLTVTVFALKAIVESLKAFPQFNASFDAATGELITKHYYHIGVAVDTEAGLVVPVIRDVDTKSILDLATELEVIAEKARNRKLTLDDMQGGTFTISNLGSLGVGSFTPIVNHPEVAILGLARGVKQPVIDEKGKVSAALQMPVSLSYDHRVVDGADGARFIRHFIDTLSTFDEALLTLKKSSKG